MVNAPSIELTVLVRFNDTSIPKVARFFQVKMCSFFAQFFNAILRCVVRRGG